MVDSGNSDGQYIVWTDTICKACKKSWWTTEHQIATWCLLDIFTTFWYTLASTLDQIHFFSLTVTCVQVEWTVHFTTALTPYVNKLRFTFFLVFCLIHHLYYQVHFAACLISSCCYPQTGSRLQELRYSEYHLPHIVPHLQAAVAVPSGICFCLTPRSGILFPGGHRPQINIKSGTSCSTCLQPTLCILQVCNVWLVHILMSSWA